MSTNTSTIGLSPVVETDEPPKPRHRGKLVIGCFTMRMARPKPPRVYRPRRARPVQLNLFPEPQTEAIPCPTPT